MGSRRVRGRGGRGGCGAAGVGVALLLAAALPVRAESDPAPAQDAAPQRPVPLDALFRLPPGVPAQAEPRPGGASRAEWEERFRAARAELAAAEQRLDKAQTDLEQLAGSSEAWQVTAPGAPAGSESGPLSFGLRQEIRRQREEVERARRSLEDLRVEANLAGVPEAWSAAGTPAPEAPAPSEAPAPAPPESAPEPARATTGGPAR